MASKQDLEQVLKPYTINATEGKAITVTTGSGGSMIITGDVADNVAQVNLKPIYNGGKAVTSSSYAPGYTAGDAAGLAVDKDNGGLNVNQGVISSTTDSIIAYGKIVEIKPTLVVDTAIYAALDNIGGKQTLTSVARASGEGVFLQSINIQVKEAVAPILDIYFFNADPTSGTYTDNAAMVIGSTDILKAIHVQQVVAADYKSVGTVRFASIQVYKDMVPSGSSTLYAAIMIASGTPTFANASNLQISYIFER